MKTTSFWEPGIERLRDLPNSNVTVCEVWRNKFLSWVHNAVGTLTLEGNVPINTPRWPLAHVTARYPHFGTPLGYAQVEQHGIA